MAQQPCRFADCLHVAEPGCSVSGLDLERYGLYLRFLAEVKVGTRCTLLRTTTAAMGCVTRWSVSSNKTQQQHSSLS